MKTFTPGNTYSCRSICDQECIFEYRVLSRTAKFIIIYDDINGIQRRGVKVDNEGEYCYPEGIYSFCPVLRA